MCASPSSIIDLVVTIKCTCSFPYHLPRIPALLLKCRLPIVKVTSEVTTAVTPKTATTIKKSTATESITLIPHCNHHITATTVTPMAVHCGLEQTRDVSTRPLALPFVHSLAPLTRSLAPDCSLHLRATLCSLICSLAHSLTPSLVGK